MEVISPCEVPEADRRAHACRRRAAQLIVGAALGAAALQLHLVLMNRLFPYVASAVSIGLMALFLLPLRLMGGSVEAVHLFGLAVSRLGPAEVVDVLVVAFILYRLLRLVRGTQATQLIAGMVLLALLGVVSVQLHLVLMGWLFQNAASVIVIVVIVLFQPELRRMLEQLGRVPHLNSSLTSHDRQVFGEAVAETIPAAERLAARKTGALIAFERDVGLEDYVETGVRLDSRLSADLLRTIFFPNSPLHDGAVIVRGAKIVAAGCVLPLPEEGSVHERLGTRHRAAIGLSLVSDALVVVVSEETGGISVVENGTITRNLDPAGLRRRLIASLHAATPSHGHQQILGRQAA